MTTATGDEPRRPPAGGALSRSQLGEAVRQAIVDLWDVPPAAVGPGTRFREELGAHELDVAELLQELEDRVGQRFSPQAYRFVNTPEAVVEYIWRLLADGQAADRPYAEARYRSQGTASPGALGR